MKHLIYDSEGDADAQNYHDEKGNLSTKSTKGTIIVVADLDLWDGHKQGYKVLGRGGIDRILGVSCGDRVKLYYDDETDNVVMEDSHHDGTNVYTFREARTRKDLDCQDLLDLIYDGNATEEDIDTYTTSLGKYVRKIYGWRKAVKKAA